MLKIYVYKSDPTAENINKCFFLSHHSDINECEIPSLAAICVDNAECCNLPGHYVCKCGPGYTGNATVSCTG